MAVGALRDGNTVAEIAHKHDVHPNQVTEWRRQLLERPGEAFGAGAKPEQPPPRLADAPTINKSVYNLHGQALEGSAHGHEINATYELENVPSKDVPWRTQT